MVPAGLERCALVRDLPPDARAVATASAERRSLLTGEVLFHRGDDGRDPYVVLSGTLEVLDDDGRAVALVRAGDVVGERTLLNGGVRNATVRAARDTDVGRFPADVLTRLFDEHPAALRGVAGMLAERMTFRASTDERHSHIVAIVGLGAPESTSAVVSSLAARDGAVVVDAARAEREVGPGAAEAVPGTPLASRVSAWLERLEATHRMLVVVCGGRRWTARCLRIADTSAAIVDGSRVPLPPRFAGLVAIGRHGGAPARGVAATWFDAVTPVRVLHVDVSSSADVGRLARTLTGDALGLVLGGGGARGLAHLGVLRAFETCGVPIDAIGGTSIGALAGAGYAMGWSHEDRLRHATKDLIEVRRLFAPTLPLVSLTSASRLTRALRSNAMFGDVAIEDLPFPFFALSASFRRGDAVVHDRDALWLAVRASCSLPGIMPPVPVGDDLLVDGGVVNNVPVDVMLERLPGRALAVNLRADAEPLPAATFGASLSGWRVLASRLGRRDAIRLPGPATMMLRAKELGGRGPHDERLALADLLIEPPVDGVDSLDFRAGLSLVDRAYAHACERIEGWLAGAGDGAADPA